MGLGAASVGYQIPTSTGGPFGRGSRSTMKPALAAWAGEGSSAGEPKAAAATAATEKKARNDMGPEVLNGERCPRCDGPDGGSPALLREWANGFVRRRTGTRRFSPVAVFTILFLYCSGFRNPVQLDGRPCFLYLLGYDNDRGSGNG